MTPQLDKAMRNGGMSRRGFLRALGVTTAAVLVPGLAIKTYTPLIDFSVQGGELWIFDAYGKTAGVWKKIYTADSSNGSFGDALNFATKHHHGYEYMRCEATLKRAGGDRQWTP